jgi:stress-induced-phosphoprotein 1
LHHFNSAQALTDAEKTVELKTDWAKGYSRKGAALYGLEQYDKAFEVYEKGLKLDPENSLLKKGLEDVQAAMMESKNPFAKLFGPDVFEKIAANPQISHYLADPAIRQKITMIQQNPALANSMMQDQSMMQLIIGLLGMNMPMGSPEDMMGGQPAPPPKAKTPEPPVVEEILSDEETAKRAARASSDAEKVLGNAEYKKRSFDAALVHYDKAFEMDGTNVAVLTNKAGMLNLYNV